MSGQPHDRMIGPDFPVELLYIWEWFSDLDFGRVYSEGGPSGLSSQEIYAWCKLNRIKLKPFEYQIIRRLDMAYLKASADYRSRAFK